MEDDAIQAECLTTWRVAEDGEHVTLRFVDGTGKPHALSLTTKAISGLMMTIPRILRRALQARFADRSYRMIHALGDWRVESAKGTDALILSLATPDGFEVAFAVPAAQAIELGAVLCTTENRAASPAAPLN